MPLSKIIEVINKSLETIKGIKIYGIAEPVTKGDAIVPLIVGNDGEMIFPGPDDIEKAIIYHKHNAIGTKLSTKKGTGDNPNEFVNAYSMSMIVYVDRQKLKLRPDEFFLFIQANIPYQISMSPYTQILTQINTVILNSQQVYDSEFKGVENKLPSNHSLLQINYTIESMFKQQCFEKCDC